MTSIGWIAERCERRRLPSHENGGRAANQQPRAL
jgi:hypothetical protein